MAIYGYARVSSSEQNEDRQLIAMQNLGISLTRIFTDKQSGKDLCEVR
jgi:DNA invertase Pin-like site-specific DNA recombinase